MILLLYSCNVVFVLHEPRMIECVIDSNALFRVLDKSLFDKIFAFFADLLPTLVAEVGIGFFNQAECVFLVTAMKRERPCEHGIDDYACGPDIDLLLVAVFVEDLWGHISWGAARLKHELPWDYDLT